MTLTAPTPTPTPAPRRMIRRYPIERTALLVVCALAYLGCLLALLQADWLFTDALSRVGNGYYALFSRDPHLAAIGFVWNPLPSVFAMPLLLAAPLVRELGSLGLAGSLPVVAAGVVTVGLVHATLTRLGAGRWTALAFAALYGLHPYVVLAAGAGSSETLLLLWLALATWALVPWVSDQNPVRLVVAAIALALAYLTRYEAIAAGLAVMIGVGVVTWGRHREERAAFVRNDIAVVGMPFVTAFLGWALASKLIVGEWFATFSSAYGNSAQVDFSRTDISTSTGGALGQVGYVLTQASGLMPALLLIVPVAIVVGVRYRPVRAGQARPRLLVLVPIATFGAVLVFQWVTTALGGSFGWLRFQIAAIPLAILLAGVITSALPRRRLVAGLALAAVAAAWPTSLWTLTRPELAREESIMRLSGSAGQHRMERDIAAWLDRQALPEGAVVTDVAYSGPIVLASDRPRQFTITTDRDFPDALRDPRGHGVRYALVTKPELSAADAVAAAYPGLYANGAGRAVLRQEWRDGRDYTWRLYEFR